MRETDFKLVRVDGMTRATDRMRTPRRARGKLLYPFVLLFAPFVLMLSACSYGTIFVVVNKSNQPIQVRYRAKKTSADVRDPCTPPATMRVEEFEARQAWHELSAPEYQVDQTSGVITLSLKPNEVLRIVVIGDPKNAEDEAVEAERFCLDEIVLSGPNGEIKLQGKQAYAGFIAESRNTRKLIYY